VVHDIEPYEEIVVGANDVIRLLRAIRLLNLGVAVERDVRLIVLRSSNACEGSDRGNQFHDVYVLILEFISTKISLRTRFIQN